MKSKQLFSAIILSVVGFVLFVGVGLPHGDSTKFNYPWSVQYIETFGWANPLPRYLPDLWHGFGGYDFFFYAPLPFWVAASAVAPLCPSCAPDAAFVIGAALFFVASGFSAYAFLRCFVSSWPAQIGAVVYALLPYHVFMDWFLRQAAGEFAAYAFLPLVALGVERIRRGENGRWLLSVSVAGTALSHLPTALLAAHVFAVLCVILAFQARKGHHDRLRLLGIYAWYATLGMGIACFYWIPAIALIETASADALFTHHYEAWRWLYGLTPSQPSLLAAIYITACFLTCMPILAVSLLSTRGAMLLWILIPTAVALFLNTALSELIWRHWIIAQVQFPWRLMVFVDLSTALAAAALASQVLSKTGKPAHYRLLPIAIVPYALFALNIDYSQARIPAEERYSSSTGAIEYLSPEMSESLSTRLGKVPLHDDLFLVADEIALLAAEFQAEIGMIDTVQDHPRAFQVTPAPSDSIVHLPVQYWFLWQAETSSGEALELRANLKFGTLDIVAPSGGFDGSAVLLTLPYHWSEKVGAAISLMALLMLAASLMRLRTQRPSLELASPD